jgi:pimeloyl-ACP methyl ester carboxylesterase
MEAAGAPRYSFGEHALARSIFVGCCTESVEISMMTGSTTYEHVAAPRQILLLLRHAGRGRVQGLINLEGNLCPEDCTFSRPVIPYTLETFAQLFDQMMTELKSSRFVGDQIIAHNMALNVDIRAYHSYSFETVEESDSGQLIEEFLSLRMPKLFLYGEQNKALSYLPRLRGSDVHVTEVPRAAHFFFYDNPVATFREIGAFVHAA